MHASKPASNSRRSFIYKSGAALGAGLASASAAATGLHNPALPLQARLEQLQKQLNVLEDSEALRHLYLAYTTLVENRAFDAVVELFAEEASVEFYGVAFTGKSKGVREFFVHQYGDQKAAAIQTAFLRDQLQRHDQLSISDCAQRASASFHATVRVSKPLQDQSVITAMARMQGIGESAAWEKGRFNIDYARIEGQWRITRLKYQPA